MWVASGRAWDGPPAGCRAGYNSLLVRTACPVMNTRNLRRAQKDPNGSRKAATAGLPSDGDAVRLTISNFFSTDSVLLDTVTQNFTLSSFQKRQHETVSTLQPVVIVIVFSTLTDKHAYRRLLSCPPIREHSTQNFQPDCKITLKVLVLTCKCSTFAC
jgi:hypothetical protein